MLWYCVLCKCISFRHFHLSYFSPPTLAPSVPRGKLVNLCRNKVTLSFNPHPSRRNTSVGNRIHPLRDCITMLTLLAQKMLAPFGVLERSYCKGWSKENGPGTEEGGIWPCTSETEWVT